jgi:hypothetical protein
VQCELFDTYQIAAFRRKKLHTPCTPKMETEGYLEKLLDFYQFTRRHIPEYKEINNRRCEKLKPHFFRLLRVTEFANKILCWQ